MNFVLQLEIIIITMRKGNLLEDEKEALLHGQFIPFGGAVAPPSRGLMASARNHC